MIRQVVSSFRCECSEAEGGRRSVPVPAGLTYIPRDEQAVSARTLPEIRRSVENPCAHISYLRTTSAPSRLDSLLRSKSTRGLAATTKHGCGKASVNGHWKSLQSRNVFCALSMDAEIQSEDSRCVTSGRWRGKRCGAGEVEKKKVGPIPVTTSHDGQDQELLRDRRTSGRERRLSS